MPAQIDTPVGVARVTWVEPATAPMATLLLGHGAGGGIEARDLRAVAAAAADAGLRVGLVEQPYRVAGKRAPAPAPTLDIAFRAVVEAVGAERLLVGGRSSGARVACRTADEIGAMGVLCLAFPLHPPGRPERSRLDELTGTRVPRLVVQGERDAFGGYDELTDALKAARKTRGVRVLCAPGADHGLKKGVDVTAVVRWLLDKSGAKNRAP
jgi:predicted alpha/beta-hydrolase family hydrolase